MSQQFRINPKLDFAIERFRVVDDWLTARRRLWEARLDRFYQYVKQLKDRESES